MTISAISSSSSGSAATAASTASRIQQLQKQIQDAGNELKQVASSDADAETKQRQTQLLQAKIQMLQAQIAALQNQQTLEAQKSAQRVAEPQVAAAVQRRSGGSLGGLVDEYV